MSGAVVVAALLAGAWQASAVLDSAYSTAAAANASGAFLVGMDFKANTDGDVHNLGAFDGGSGFGGYTIQVGLFLDTVDSGGNITGGSLIASANFSGNGSGYTRAGGNYLFQSVGDVMLQAGSTYSIVAANSDGSAANWFYNSAADAGASQITGQNFSGAITLLNTAGFANWNSDLTTTFAAYPFSESTYKPLRFGGGNFDFTPVPEATAFGAAAVGLLGLVYIVRYAGLRRKVKLS
jgi:hypothetical protein